MGLGYGMAKPVLSSQFQGVSTGLCEDRAELALPVLILGPSVYRDMRGTTTLLSPSWGVPTTLHTSPLQLGLCRV